MNIRRAYNIFIKEIKWIAWRMATKKCPQCHGTGRVMGQMNPPSWTIHGKFLKAKNFCGICHSFGRVPIFQKKKKINWSEMNTVHFKEEKSRRMPWIPEKGRRGS